ncbi:MAG: response regulator, partial [Candidatus Acidiferrales bacterium]
MKVSNTETAPATAPILLIEDEVSVAAFVRTALERRGYRVVPSPSAAEGLRLLETGEFCGVISDVRTPGGVSGADVHSWMREHKPELLEHLIFITGDIANRATAALLEESGAPFVEKPFRVAQILSMVETTIGKPREQHD